LLSIGQICAWIAWTLTSMPSSLTKAINYLGFPSTILFSLFINSLAAFHASYVSFVVCRFWVTGLIVVNVDKPMLCGLHFFVRTMRHWVSPYLIKKFCSRNLDKNSFGTFQEQVNLTGVIGNNIKGWNKIFLMFCLSLLLSCHLILTPSNLILSVLWFF